MFKKILIAVSSGSADTVLTSAIDVARKFDARITTLHVVDATPCFIGPLDHGIGIAIEGMEAHGREISAQASQTLADHACRAESHMVMLPLSGCTVGHAIATFAEESGFDLILLGERKVGWWQWLNEDVAAQVRRHTTKPIQIVSGKCTPGRPRHPGTRQADAPAAY